MRCCYMDGDSLVAAIERCGGGRAPVRWVLRWSVRLTAAGLEDGIYTDRGAAVARVLEVCPHAVVEVYSARGERVR